jgi:hypothetical protein
MLPQANAVLFLPMIFHEFRIVNIFVMLEIHQMLMLGAL